MALRGKLFNVAASHRHRWPAQCLRRVLRGEMGECCAFPEPVFPPLAPESWLLRVVIGNTGIRENVFSSENENEGGVRTRAKENVEEKRGKEAAEERVRSAYMKRWGKNKYRYRNIQVETCGEKKTLRFKYVFFPSCVWHSSPQLQKNLELVTIL